MTEGIMLGISIRNGDEKYQNQKKGMTDYPNGQAKHDPGILPDGKTSFQSY
jgi:hypothetical protein